ncbi:MAG: SGNH/GDSL hydrolase family protein [Chloroflexota bacterium]
MNFNRYWTGLWIFFVFLIAACAPKLDVSMQAPGSTEQSALRYLALGDSYTIGEGVKNEDSFPYQLIKALEEDGFSFNQPQVIARTGWTTDELIRAIEKDQPQGTYDLVTLLIGVNNQFRGYSMEIYRSEFRELLNRSIQYADNQAGCVVVLSIPDWGVTPIARTMGVERGQVSSQIDRFNDINREEAELAGVRYVDVTGISRTAADDSSLIAEDGLHPSSIMYQAWVESVLPEAKACLNEK